MNKITKHNLKKSFLKHKTSNLETSSGFTLVETVVAIFILSMTIGSLLTLAAGGFFSVRYARNQIVADNLAQEALEYIRNDRDSAIQAGATWNNWRTTLTSGGCMSNNGCRIDPYTTSSHIVACGSGCPVLKYSPTGMFYGYTSGENTTYVRTVTIDQVQGNKQLVVTARMSWKNGTNSKTVSQSMLLTDWNI